MKTIQALLHKRSWIAFIDDERSQGNSIIVTLKNNWFFSDENGCGVRGFDTIKELEEGTRKNNVSQI